MGEIFYEKLVRNKIPAIIEADNQQPIVHVLDDNEFRRALLDKLIEEATELRDANGEIGERADIAEVLRAIDQLYGYSPEQVEQARAVKASARGDFSEQLFLEKAITND